MRKSIKFDLLLGDTFIHTVDELRAAFGSSVIPVFRQGLLTKWFYHQDRSIYEALRQLPETLSDQELFWNIARLIQPAEIYLDGVSIQTLDGLTDHFSVDILRAFRSGELSSFLDRIGETELFAKVAALPMQLSDVAAFERLCELFGVEFDLDIALLMLGRGGYNTVMSESERVAFGDEDEPVLSESLASLSVLTEDDARRLVKTCSARELAVECAALSESAADILIRHQGVLDSAFSAFSFTAGNIADTLLPNQLTFTYLSSLSPEIARILSRFSGVLSFSALSELSFEAAQQLNNRTGGIRFESVRSISFETVAVLVEEQIFGIYPAFLDFSGLQNLDTATARLFEDFKGELYLGLSELSIETAEILARRKAKTVLSGLINVPEALAALICDEGNTLYYPGFAHYPNLSETQARHLVQNASASGWPCYPFSLSLKTRTLTAAAAAQLIQYGGRLVFESLVSLTPDVAQVLSRHQLWLRDNIYQIDMGPWLSFPKLTSISRECMHYFVQGKTNAQLAFDGLDSLDIEVAKELSNLKKSALLLNGVRRIDTQAAAYLAKMENVTLQLNRLPRLPLSLARAFCNDSGFLCLFLGGVVAMEPETEKWLTFYFSGQLFIRGRMIYSYRGAQRVKQQLFPDFLGLADALSTYGAFYD